MFSCLSCPEQFELQDVAEGKYFVSTGVCLPCYEKMYFSRVTCFGKKKFFDEKSIACGSECPDRRVCRSVIQHRNQFISISDDEFQRRKKRMSKKEKDSSASDASASSSSSEASASEASASEASASESSASSSASSSSSERKSSKVKKTDKKKSSKKDKKEKKSKKKETKPSSKDKKHSKDKKKSKTGPKGSQWKGWKAPFQPGSNFDKLFQLLAGKHAVKASEFNSKAKKYGANPAFVYRNFRKGKRPGMGWTWNFDDAHGKLHITKVKKH